MDTAIIVLVLICLALHSYINTFRRLGLLSDSMVFLLFGNGKVELLLILVNSLHLFGWLYGILIALACYLGGQYIVLPVTLLLAYLMPSPTPLESSLGARPKPLPWLFVAWTWLLIALVILTVVSFFV